MKYSIELFALRTMKCVPGMEISMSPIEIIFVLLGVGILIASCFVGRKDTQTEKENLGSEEILELQKKDIRSYAEQILTEKSEECIVKTDDYLSKISNEKIMSVNDFSTQILEKIDTNHKEVVFLYDMLNQKEDEIKQEVQKLDAEKQELREAAEQIILLTKQIQQAAGKSDYQKNAKKEKGKKAEEKKVGGKSVDEQLEQPSKQPEISVTQPVAEGHPEFSDTLQADWQKEAVLKLHKQGKSILEISKTLEMGQGEVKLIIGLYGA